MTIEQMKKDDSNIERYEKENHCTFIGCMENDEEYVFADKFTDKLIFIFKDEIHFEGG